MRYQKLKSPLSVHVEITDNCNEACSHCYRSCQIINKRNVSVLAEIDTERIVERLSDADVFLITITGGEPLLYPKSVLACARATIRLGIQVQLNSNLQALSDEMLSFVAENGINILTSIAADTASVHDRIVGLVGSHERIVRNIKRLVSLGVRVSANMVVRSDNHSRVYETGMFVHSLGVEKFAATKAVPVSGVPYEGYAPDRNQIIGSLDDLLRIQEETGMVVDSLEPYPLCFLGDLSRYRLFARKKCSAGVYSCSIGPSGSVSACPHSDLVYGNLLEEPLADIWIRMNGWRDAEFINEDCVECPYLYECRGGCKEDAYILSGDRSGRDPLMTEFSDVVPSEELFSCVVEFGNDDVFRFHSNCKWREEPFGGLVVLREGMALFGEDGWKIFQGLNRKSFSANEIAQVFGIGIDEVRQFLSFLFLKGMLLT